MTSDVDRKKRKPDGPAGSYGRGSFKRHKHHIDPGDRGVLLSSSSPNRTKETIREFVDIVSQFEASLVGTAVEDQKQTSPRVREEENEETTEDSNAIDELESSLASELEDLTDKTKRFVPIREIVRCVSFVKFCRKEDIPSLLVSRILSTAHSGKRYPCKYLTRIIPLDAICKPYAEHFEKAITPLIASSLPESAAAHKKRDVSEGHAEEEVKEAITAQLSPRSVEQDESKQTSGVTEARSYVGTWSCRYNGRNVSTLKKSEVLDILTRLVGPKYKVDITKAEHTIIVEVTAPFCGVGIVSNYQKFAGLNIFTLTHKDSKSRGNSRKSFTEDEGAVKPLLSQAEKTVKEDESPTVFFFFLKR